MKPIEISWNWPGWVGERDVAIVYGDSDAGKSMALLPLAMSMVAGVPLFEDAPTSGGPVVYIAYNERMQENHRRLQALGRGATLQSDALADLHLIDSPVPLLTEAHAHNLRILCRDYRPRTVILDSVSSHAQMPEGGIKDTNRVRAMLDTIVRPVTTEYGVTIYLVAHTAKWTTGTPSPLGSVQWKAGTDDQIYVSARIVDGQKRITLESKRVAPGGTLPPPIWVEFHDLNPEKTSIEIRSGRGVAQQPREPIKVDPHLKPLVRYLRKAGGSSMREHAVRYFKSKTPRTVERWLTDAVERGYVAHGGKGKPYVLAEGLAA